MTTTEKLDSASTSDSCFPNESIPEHTDDQLCRQSGTVEEFDGNNGKEESDYGMLLQKVDMLEDQLSVCHCALKDGPGKPLTMESNGYILYRASQLFYVDGSFQSNNESMASCVTW